MILVTALVRSSVVLTFERVVAKPHNMIDEREIWACAHQLLRQHGDSAWFVAAQRAEALLEQGDMDGARTFKQILARIRALQELEPSSVIH